MLVAFHAVFQILDEYFGGISLAKVVSTQSQERTSVCVKSVALCPEIIKGLALEFCGLMGSGSLLVQCQSVQHPRLHIWILFLFDEVLVEIAGPARQNLRLNCDPGLLG